MVDLRHPDLECCSVSDLAHIYLGPSLPSVTLRNDPATDPLKVYSEDGKLFSEFGSRRTPITSADVPQDFIHALLSPGTTISPTIMASM